MTPLARSVAAIVDRELETLARELEAYPDDEAVWRLPDGLPNSAGTLVLHLCGNLRHFLGARLGGDGYVRDRPAEFATRDLPRTALLAEIAATRRAAGAALDGADEAPLAEEYPEPVGGHRFAAGDFLLHLVAHLAYHLGQVDYHRRAVTGRRDGVGPLPIDRLASARPAD